MYDDLEYLNLKLEYALNGSNPNAYTIWRLRNQVRLMEDTIDIYEKVSSDSYKKVNAFTGMKLLKKHKL